MSEAFLSMGAGDLTARARGLTDDRIAPAGNGGGDGRRAGDGKGRLDDGRSRPAGLSATTGGKRRAPVASAAPGKGLPSPTLLHDGASGQALDLPADHTELRDLALGCTRCTLSGGRKQVVFNDGVLEAEVMVVGEAPGAHEDATGLPFVGPAGRLLDLMLASVGLSRRENVYIANVLKCRPPQNRNPRPEEIESCSPFLLRQVETVRPRAVLAVGAFAGRLLTGRERDPLGRLRGRVHEFRGIPLVVTYHPAALLRQPGWTRDAWRDLQLLRRTLAGI